MISGLLTAVSMLMAVAVVEQHLGLTLEEAVERAVASNERSRMADENREVAAAQLDMARAYFFPQVTAMGTYTRRLQATVKNINGQEVVIQSVNAVNATLGANVVLFDAQAIPAYQSAARSASAAELNAQELKRQLAFDAARAFLQVLTSEHVRDAAQGRVAFAQQSLVDAKARFSAQLVGTNDVTRAELELAVARTTLANAEGVVGNNYLQLGQILAEPVQPPVASPDGLFEQAHQARPPTGLAEVALQRRLDLRAQQQAVEAARLSAMRPPLRLVPTLGASGQMRATNEAGLTGRPLDGSATITLTWPLYDGGYRTASERQADALASLAQLQALALSRQVTTDVEKAVTMLEATRAALAQAVAAATAAQRNADETSALYREGLANALAVEDASAKLFKANVALARERSGVVSAYLNLRSALGLNPLGQEPL